MWFYKDRQFVEEASTYRLAFTCEECCHFLPHRNLCTVFYPTEPHRQAHVDDLAEGERLTFCKMFEGQ